MAAKLNHFVGSFVDDAAVNTYISGNGWTAEEGWVYYNTTSSELRWWNGTAWQAGGLVAHATTHQSGGSDPIKLDDLAAPDDNTDLNSTVSAHGLLPKLGGGTVNYLRADGTWATPSGSGSDLRTACIIVGNSVAGDTLANCDYLDTGDGVQLVAALAAAGGANKDVYIRKGLYDLGAGSATAPYIVPVNVRVRGAGRRHVTLKTKTTDQGAVQLNGVLEDVNIDVALPTGACSGQTSVVLFNSALAEAHRVSVDFLGTYTATESGYSILKGVFGAVTNTIEDSKLIDCTAGTKAAPVPSFIALGEALADALRVVYIPSSTSLLNVMDIRGLISHGADIAVDLEAKARVTDYTIYDAYRYGAWLHGCSSPSIVHGEINMVADQGNEVGILLDTVTDAEVDVARVIASTGSAGTKALAFTGADDNTARGVRVSSGWGTGADLDSTSDDNLVIGNHFANATTSTSDAGSLNDLAHNKV